MCWITMNNVFCKLEGAFAVFLGFYYGTKIFRSILVCQQLVSAKNIMRFHERTCRRIKDLRNGAIGFVLRDRNYV